MTMTPNELKLVARAVRETLDAYQQAYQMMVNFLNEVDETTYEESSEAFINQMTIIREDRDSYADLYEKLKEYDEEVE